MSLHPEDSKKHFPPCTHPAGTPLSLVLRFQGCVTWEVVGQADGVGTEQQMTWQCCYIKGRKAKPMSRILTVSPILSPMQDLSPGMTSSLRQVALKARDSSSGRSRTSSSTLERIF